MWVAWGGGCTVTSGVNYFLSLNIIILAKVATVLEWLPTDNLLFIILKIYINKYKYNMVRVHTHRRVVLCTHMYNWAVCYNIFNYSISHRSLTANANVATVLGSILASSYTVGRQMEQCLIQYLKKIPLWTIRLQIFRTRGSFSVRRSLFSK